MAEIYFSGQGKLFVAERDGSGNPLVLKDLGNVPSLTMNLETDILEHKESRTGSRLTDLRLVRERKANVTMALEDFNVNNLKMLLYGTSTTSTPAVQTDEASPAGLVFGDNVALTHSFVNSAGFVVESYGTTTTWTLGTHYTVDYDAGIVTPTAAGLALATRFQTTYTPKARTMVPMFKDSQKERFLRFSGLNTANSNAPVIVELYRVAFDPTSSFDLITDELAQFELNGSVLYDSTRDLDPVLGGFGRIITL